MTSNPKESDSEIHKLLLDKQEAGLEAFLRIHGGPIVISIRSRFPMQHCDAEEILFETCLKLWQHPDKFNPQKGSLRAWALKIAANMVKDRLKSRHQLANLLGDSDESIPNRSPSPPSSARQLQLIAATRDVVAGMTPRQQKVVQWNDTRALSDELMLTPKSIRATRSKCLAKIRDQLMKRGWQLDDDGLKAPNDFPYPAIQSAFREEIENLPPLQQEILTADLGRGRSAESETLAEYAGTTKGAIYAARHRARVKIKHALIRRGFLIAEIQDLFSSVVNISLDNGE